MRLHKGAAHMYLLIASLFWSRFGRKINAFLSLLMFEARREQNKRRVERAIHQTDWRMKELEA